MKRSLLFIPLLSFTTVAMYAQTGKQSPVKVLTKPPRDKQEEPSLPQNGSAISPVPSYPKQQDTDPHFIYRTVEVKPQPAFDLPGYLNKYLLYPEAARENKVQGRLTAQFVVEKDGSITDIKVIKGEELQHGLPEEVIRVIKSMPKWTPGKQNGQPVRSYYMQPFNFALQ